VAKLDGVSPPLRVDPVDPEAKMFFAGDPARVATTKLWAAIAATRVGECPRALPLLRDYLHVEGDPPGRVAAVLALARCDAWDEALPLARTLAATNARHETLVTNLEWTRAVLDFSKRRQFASNDETPTATTADKALECSRAYTLLLDRRRAYHVLAEWEPTLLHDRAAATFYARAAWAAGEDDAARRALAAHLGPSDATPLLASWSRELGRD
jgi:hypothetical protein